MTTAIEAVGLSKEYHIAALSRQKLTLQERLAAQMSAPFRRAWGLLRGRAGAAADLNESFWALRDVNFTIGEGEVVGVIGQNGAGKSTLLKILSKVTEPTEGSAMVRGRFGSLLEVGTGFHQQLSGRENVFLNGSILGMRRNEVRRKFDEIVEFSEVGAFIDTPVKYYSSGMRVRLAFAVAAHLDPDVLFVDEVLAVGDIGFQKKCKEKVHEVARSGATVLVVSHNAASITAMCERVIWLDKGRLVADGPAKQIVSDYLNRGVKLAGERVWAAEEAPGGEVARILAMRIKNGAGETTNQVDVREKFCVEAEVEVLKRGYSLVFRHELQASDGSTAFSSLDARSPTWEKIPWEPGRYTLRMWVPGNFLQLDTYSITTGMGAWEPVGTHECTQRNVLNVQIVDQGVGLTARGGFSDHFPGPIRPLLDWDMEHHREPARVSNVVTEIRHTNGVRSAAPPGK